jgi:hypothetical protein
MPLKHGGTLCALACATAAMMLFTDETSAAEKEPVAVLELGAAGAWDLRGGSSFGPAVALEFEPVKDNLVIEAGLAPLFDRSGHADWDFDLLFRRPFDLSKKVEFEPGVGPTFNGSGQVGAQVSFELMIWTSAEREFGWFIDPSYSVSLAPGHQQSVGLNLGLLFAIPSSGKTQKGPRD